MKNDKRYHIVDEEVEKQLREIKRLVRASMNGVAADKMAEQGLVYRQNFGVALPRLKEIAALYAENRQLAQRLRALEMREAMILAFILSPKQNRSADECMQWLAELPTVEMAEMGSMLFFSRVDCAAELVAASPDALPAIGKTAWLLTANRIVEQLTTDQLAAIVDTALSEIDVDNYSLCNAVGLLLGHIAAYEPSLADHITAGTKAFETSEHDTLRLINQLIRQEIG